MNRKDKSLLGREGTALEPGIDLNRLRHERLGRIQRELTSRGIGALLLTNPVSIRYATGVSIIRSVQSPIA